MATAVGRHQPAKSPIGRQRRLHRRTAVHPPSSSRDGELVGQDRASDLHDLVAQVSGQFTERSAGALDALVLQRSQLGQTAIFRRTFLPDAAGLPAAAKRAPAIQPRVALVEGDSRRIEEVRAGSTVGNLVAAATGRQTEGQATSEARQAREVRPGTGSVPGLGDVAGEQVEQLRLRQQEHLATESELEER